MNKHTLFQLVWPRDYKNMTFKLLRPRAKQDPIFRVVGLVNDFDSYGNQFTVLVVQNILTRCYHAMVEDVPYGKYEVLD